MKHSRFYIIGCGGVGSWLAPSLCMLLPKTTIELVDGDKFEMKNLSRQLFELGECGRNKASVLARKYHCNAHEVFYTEGTIDHERGDWIIVCADNNPARRAALTEADRNGCKVVVAANERNSAESYYYQPDWKGTPRDPRVYYPELLTGNAGDPLMRGAGCTGDAQTETPQLVSANFMAASLAQWLIVLWALEAPKLDADVIPTLPYKLVANMTKLENFNKP